MKRVYSSLYFKKWATIALLHAHLSACVPGRPGLLRGTVLRLEQVRPDALVHEALEEAELHAFRLAARARRGPEGGEGVRRKIPNDALPGTPVPGAALFSMLILYEGMIIIDDSQT